MDSTTLITFLYKTRPEVRSVELVGSWDNFSRPYRMQRDAHKGRGIWTGCHSFENIICDGDRIDRSRPRNGALKQGGTYWYYVGHSSNLSCSRCRNSCEKQYRLDDEEEACDSSRPTTAACPLLPGQTVNVLDIPIEVVDRPKRVHSASADIPCLLGLHMTFDPADRYKKVYPKPPTKLPRFYCSSDALRERFQSDRSRFFGDASAQQSPRLRSRASSPAVRSIKRVRCDASPYQIPGACQIHVTPDDIAMLANIPDFDNANRIDERPPQLRPFAPCSQSSIEERPVTRGRMLTDFTQELSSFNSNQESRRSSRIITEDTPMNFEYTQLSSPLRYMSQYDGAEDEAPSTDSIERPQWPLSPPTVPNHEQNWPLARPNPLRSNPAMGTFPLSGVAATSISNIPTLDLINRFINDQPHGQPYPSPAASSIVSDGYHPGFGPSANATGTGLFDMTSPTFTAETINSTPEIRTPEHFRLSTHSQPSENLDSSVGLEELSHRLSQLTSSESEYDDEYDDDEDSLYQDPNSDFYGFSDRVPEDNETYAEPNASCLTLKPPSAPKKVLDTPSSEIMGFTLSLPSTAGSFAGGSDIAAEFSSDVLGALGIAV